MNQEDVLRAAMRVGLVFELPPTKLLEFAALVAAHEREACARVCDEEANDLSCGEDWNDCGRYLAKTIRSRT